jgi:hypothetical protein
MFATSHAHAINAFTVKSAGTTFACTEPSQWIDRSNPVPAPAATPVGPYKLSIQPRSGSRYVEITVRSQRCDSDTFLVGLTSYRLEFAYAIILIL